MGKEKQIEEMAKITANAIEKKVCEKCEDCKWNGSGSKDADCTDYICAEALYNAGYRKQEWISVEERLPEDCGMPVLMVAVNSYNQMCVVKGFTDYQCPITFHTNEREYDGVWRAWEVTHWMPLPEAPKMKGGAE